MFDIMGLHHRLESVYLKYIDSSLPLRYDTLNQERRKHLSQAGVLSQSPLIESIPVYPSSGYTLSQAAEALDCPELAALAAPLMPEGRTLYTHQWQALQSVMQDRRDLVVTTGTGSGKTESFLLPLLAELGRESRTWEPPEFNDSEKWWESLKTPRWQSQFEHIQRPQAVRALILYPLNALVEDQLRRLRLTLNDPGVLDWLDQEAGGNRITFGRYNGQTPVSGAIGKASSQKRLTEWMQRLARQSEAFKSLSKDKQQEIFGYFQEPDNAEMLNRWDMQTTPPDILITNYSMLNIMLMRAVESEIFTQTREWLQADASHRFFLVVDELHAFRGTPGTEVSYLLRLLLQRLGLTPESQQLVILATSASMPNEDASRQFLNQFFGRDRFDIIQHTSQSTQRSLPELRQLLNQEAETLIAFSQAIASDSHALQSQSESEALGCLQACLPPDLTVADYLQSHQLHTLVRETSQCLFQEDRPVLLETLRDTLLPEHAAADRVLHGLLSALTLSKLEHGQALQALRGHFFFKNHAGLLICPDPQCSKAERSPEERQRTPVGALHSCHQLVCDCQSRLLDLLNCRACGEVFLGGFAREEQNGVTSLSPDQPDLEGLPDNFLSNPNARNYRVLWPQRAHVVLDQSSFSFTVRGEKFQGSWQRKALNHRLGILTDVTPEPSEQEVVVYEYFVKERYEKEAPALPTRCPHCQVDYAPRKSGRKTPLRKHITGFQTVAQLLAGVINREMPEDSRKLVVFTDSRQDAAKLSAGIEQDHYRDLIRQALHYQSKAFATFLVSVLRVLLSTDPEDCMDWLREEYPELATAVAAEPQTKVDVARFKQFQKEEKDHANLLSNWSRGLLDDEEEAEQEWSELRELFAAWPHGVRFRDLRRLVMQQLLQLGHNPGGIGVDVQSFKSETQDPVSWQTLFDWRKTPILRKSHLPEAAEALWSRIDMALRDELVGIAFMSLRHCLESLGLATVTVSPGLKLSTQEREVVQGVVRMLGTRQKVKGKPWFKEGTKSDVPVYVREYIRHCGLDPDTLLGTLVDEGVLIPTDSGVILEPEKLFLLQAHADTKTYVCGVCQNTFLHQAGGYCPDCLSLGYQGPVNQLVLTEGERRPHQDYYSFLTLEAGEPLRLHAEELTGQTDDADRVNRQRWFQDVFLEDENERVQGIDLLSVTTTMEAGVDIGGLNAVLMANMPPRRFNYQQRVGRAGRRGAGLSVALTLCRNRSHDEYYYAHPEKITGDPSPAPYLDKNSEEILRRVFTKAVLHRAFKELKAPLMERSSVHGEFGSVDDWPEIRAVFSQWLSQTRQTGFFEETLHYLLVNNPLATTAEAKRQLTEQLIDELQGLPDTIDEVIRDPGYNQDALSERLAYAGLLPMFGFPTRVRQFHTHWPNSQRDTGISRPLEQAISSFAPGSQLVRDKMIHTAWGVLDTSKYNKPFSPPLEEKPFLYILCADCRALLQGNESASDKARHCEVCKSEKIRHIDAREPKDFFSTLRAEDYTGYFEWSPFATRPALVFSRQEPTQFFNAQLSVAADQLISINDNNAQGGFTWRKTVHQKNAKKYAAWCADLKEVSKEPPATASWIQPEGKPERFALLSRRHTDVFILGLQTQPDAYTMSPDTPIGRSAWLSLAFLMRSAAAVLLDVEPQELDAGFRTINREGQPSAELFLADSLDNGAGYCRYLGQPDVMLELMTRLNPQAGSIAEGLLQHEGCDTSCNLCLRDYTNLPYHALLDWRLALEMVRLLHDEDAHLDLSSDWSDTYINPWQSLLEPGGPIDTLHTTLGYTRREIEGLVAYESERRSAKKLRVLAHPLWKIEHPDRQRAQTYIDAHYSSADDIRWTDPWILLRRPGEAI